MSQTIMSYLEMTRSDFPFFGSAQNPSCVINPEFQNMLQHYMLMEYYSYTLLNRFQHDYEYGGEPVLTTSIQTVCDIVYISHAYTYQKLYDTTVLTYNPIENYNMKEHESVVNSGNDTTTNHNDAHTDKDSRGAYTDTDSFGQDHSTSDSTGDKAPFDSQSYKHLDKGHDETTRDSRTDTHGRSAVENSMEYGEENGSTTLEHGHEIERDLTRSGNVGVTTSQQMIESERQVAMFNFVKIVANDLIHMLTKCNF